VSGDALLTQCRGNGVGCRHTCRLHHHYAHHKDTGLLCRRRQLVMKLLLSVTTRTRFQRLDATFVLTSWSWPRYS